MNKKQRLNLSQKQHMRLNKKHYTDCNIPLSSYHKECVVRQKKLGRILTHKEKDEIYLKEKRRFSDFNNDLYDVWSGNY